MRKFGNALRSHRFGLRLHAHIRGLVAAPTRPSSVSAYELIALPHWMPLFAAHSAQLRPVVGTALNVRGFQRVTDQTRFRIAGRIVSVLASVMPILPCRAATGSPPSSPAALASP
eukprot:5081716-Pleurochrysis_carterae.AAC.1